MDHQAGIAISNGAQLPSRDAVTRQDRQCFVGFWSRQDQYHSDTAIKRPHHFFIGNVATPFEAIEKQPVNPSYHAELRHPSPGATLWASFRESRHR